MGLLIVIFFIKLVKELLEVFINFDIFVLGIDKNVVFVG